MKPEKLALQTTIESLPYWSPCIEGTQSVKKLFELFDTNIQIPGVLVFEQGMLIGLIPREKLYEKLGRPFGVELFLKNTTRQFYDGLQINSLIIKSDTTISEAVQMALGRDASALYDPIVVSHTDGYRVITMYNLLMAQQETLQNLYSEVHNLSIMDPLTQVNNRRGFFEIANQKLVAIRHFDLEYAIMMIDIDLFKHVNDRYGHQVGDEVIRSVVQQISLNLKDEDVLARFGGEEFVILMMNVTRQEAFQAAEKLRQVVASAFHNVNGFQIRVTICLGISHSSGANKQLDRLLTEADQAMYAAKSMGRNMVVKWHNQLDDKTLPPGRKMFRVSENEPAPLVNQFAEQMLQTLLHMLYLRDYETEVHTTRVTKMVIQMAQKIGLSEKDLEGIYIGALLHDIGKIAIPDQILFKREELTKSEWAIMEKHPQYAYDLISPVACFQHALDIPYCHHEHWDGSGYPRGLKGTDIPIAARLFTIVDAYDALTSDRPYRAAWSHKKAVEFLKEQAGETFDPDLVPPFLKILAENRIQLKSAERCED